MQVTASITAVKENPCWATGEAAEWHEPDFFVAQHEAFGGWFASRSAAATTNCGGVTSFALAQASFCWFEKQQQPCQHCWALRQPQWRYMQGNGCERSLPSPSDHSG